MAPRHPPDALARRLIASVISPSRHVQNTRPGQQGQRPKPKADTRTKPGRNHDSGQVTCFSLARDTGLEIQTPPSGETQTPRQPAGSPIHVSNNPRPTDETAIRPDRPNPSRAKGGKPKHPKGRNSSPKTLKLFILAYRASRYLRPFHAGYRLAGSSHRIPRSSRPKAGSAKKMACRAGAADVSASASSKLRRDSLLANLASLSKLRRLVEPDGIEPTT